MTTDNPFLSIRARGVLLWVLIGLSIYGLFYGITTRLLHIAVDDVLQGNLVSIFFFGSVLLWIRSKSGPGGIIPSLYIRGGWNINLISVLGLMVVVFLFSLSAVWLTYFPLTYISPSLVDSLVLKREMIPSETTQPLLNTILKASLLVIVAPVVEEGFFRGILLNRWATKWGLRVGIITSSLAFAIQHMNLVGAFAFGIVMALLYTKTKTLVAPVAAHCFNNTLGLVIDLLDRRVLEDAYGKSIDEFRSGIWKGAVLFAITLPFLLIYFKRNWPTEGKEPPYVNQQKMIQQMTGQKAIALK